MNDTRIPTVSEAIEGKVIYVLGIVALAQFSFPITEGNNLALLIVYQVIYASMFIAGIVVARKNRRLVRFLSVLGLAWLITGIVYTLNLDALWAILLSYVVVIIFQSAVTGILIRYIFITRHITRDVLFAAIAVYLLLGGIFVPIYGLIDSLTLAFSGGTLNAFSGGIAGSGSVFAWQDFIYYSYVTLTTLGYGDILPVTMLAKAAVAIEAIIGVMYVTIIMARLVSLYSADVQSE